MNWWYCMFLQYTGMLTRSFHTHISTFLQYVSSCSDNTHFRYLSNQEEEWIVVAWQVEHHLGPLNSCVCTKAGIFEETLGHFQDIFQPCLWPKNPDISLKRHFDIFRHTKRLCWRLKNVVFSAKTWSFPNLNQVLFVLLWRNTKWEMECHAMSLNVFLS